MCAMGRYNRMSKYEYFKQIFKLAYDTALELHSVACPGIRKAFFLNFNFSRVAVHKIAEKMIFVAKKVAKYR